MVWPYFEGSFKYLEHAVGYGRLVLTYLVVLNSGGLVALPAYIQLFEQPETIPVYTILWISAALVIGIVAAMLAIFLAYLNFSLHAANAQRDFMLVREYADIDIPYPGFTEKDYQEHLARASKIVKDREKYSLLMNLTTVLPIALGVISAVSFLFGGTNMVLAFVAAAGV